MESITLLIISLFNNSFCDNTGEIIKIDTINNEENIKGLKI